MAPCATGWQCYNSELFTTVDRQCYRSCPCIDICIGNLVKQCTVCMLESNKLEERITNVSLISEICKNKFQFLKDYVIRVPMGEICDLWVDVYRKHSYNLIWILTMLSNKFYFKKTLVYWLLYEFNQCYIWLSFTGAIRIGTILGNPQNISDVVKAQKINLSIDVLINVMNATLDFNKVIY